MPKHVLKHLETEKSSNYMEYVRGEEFYLFNLLLNEDLWRFVFKKDHRNDFRLKDKSLFYGLYYIDKKNDFEMFVVSKSVS